MVFSGIGVAIAGLVGQVIGRESMAAKVIGWTVAITLLVLVLSVGKCAYDKSVIDQNEKDITAEINESLIEAEREANAATDESDEKFGQSESDITEGMEDAKANDPEGAARPVGPVSQSYYDRLRKSQNSERN